MIIIILNIIVLYSIKINTNSLLLQPINKEKILQIRNSIALELKQLYPIKLKIDDSEYDEELELYDCISKITAISPVTTLKQLFRRNYRLISNPNIPKLNVIRYIQTHLNGFDIEELNQFGYHPDAAAVDQPTIDQLIEIFKVDKEIEISPTGTTIETTVKLEQNLYNYLILDIMKHGFEVIERRNRKIMNSLHIHHMSKI